MEEYTQCFSVVDLRKDERLMPGDLVSSHGHIAMVESYDYNRREITTFEAKSGGFGTVGIGRKPLTEPDCQGPDPKASHNWKNRPFRADLRVLRFSPHKGCHLKPRQ
jgi:hypothetical protein